MLHNTNTLPNVKKDYGYFMDIIEFHSKLKKIEVYVSMKFQQLKLIFNYKVQSIY